MWNKSPYQVTLLRLVYLVMSESVSLEKKKLFFSLRRIISGYIHHRERGEISQIFILKQVYYSAFLYIQKIFCINKQSSLLGEVRNTFNKFKEKISVVISLLLACTLKP